MGIVVSKDFHVPHHIIFHPFVQIDVSCWTNDPDINAWNKARNVTDPGYIVSFYYMEMMASLRRAGFKPIFFAGESVCNNCRVGVVVWTVASTPQHTAAPNKT